MLGRHADMHNVLYEMKDRKCGAVCACVQNSICVGFQFRLTTHAHDTVQCSICMPCVCIVSHTYECIRISNFIRIVTDLYTEFVYNFLFFQFVFLLFVRSLHDNIVCVLGCAVSLNVGYFLSFMLRDILLIFNRLSFIYIPQ